MVDDSPGQGLTTVDDSLGPGLTTTSRKLGCNPHMHMTGPYYRVLK